MKTAKTKKRNFSPAQLRAQARFAKAAKAGTLKRKKRNTTIIKAKKISHLDVSKVHNPQDLYIVEFSRVDGPTRIHRTVDVHAKSKTEAIRKVKEKAPEGSTGFSATLIKKRTERGKRRNAEHRDAQHPIHVRDYWQGRRGYKSQWQRAHEAGQRQLFGVKNPGMTADQHAVQKAWETKMRASKEWKAYEKALMAAYEENSPLMIKRADAAYKKWESLVKRTRPFTWSEAQNRYIAKKKNPRRGTRAIAHTTKLVGSVYGKQWAKKHETQLLKQKRTERAIQSLHGKKRTVSARRNGSHTSLAKQRRAEFVGRPSTKLKTLYAPNGSGASGTLSQLGKLHKIKVKGGKEYNFKGVPVLAQHPKTDQLFVLGKNYTVNVPKKNPGDRMVDLGEVRTIEYEAVKTHLGDTKPVRYYHHFGEEGGERPHALVNSEGLVLFSGGDYYIRPEGIRD